MQNKYNFFKMTLTVIIVILIIGLTLVPTISSLNNPFEPVENPISKKTKFNPFKEGWKYSKKITIDHNEVAGNLVNFPFLVSTIDSDLHDKAQIDGDDILFMNHPGKAEQLFHEIECYNGDVGELVTWVNIPRLSSHSDTKIYMYYGNPDCENQQKPERVWDDYYIGIWHMNDNTVSSINDSTKNNNDGTKKGLNEPIETRKGKIAEAQDFDGFNDYISTDELLTDGSDFTMSLWINPNITYNYGAPQIRILNDRGRIIIEHGNPRRAGPDAISIRVYDGFVQRYTSYSVDLLKSKWYHFTGSFDGTNLNFYIDGHLVDSTFGEWVGLNYDSVIGSDRGGDQFFFNGIIDEVRISYVERTSEWINTTYSTMNNPPDFFTYSPEYANQKTYNLISLHWLLDRFPLLHRLLSLLLL